MIGVIPAAGKGIRFKELGKEYPKAILPYKNKPILIYNIENMLSVCDEVRIVIGHQKNKIVDIVNQYYEFDPRIIFKEQETLSGLSSAVYDSIKNIEIDQPLLVVLGDLLVESPLDFINENTKSFVSVKEVPDYSRWCMVESDSNSGQVIQFFDKPKEKPPTNLAVSGVYYFKSLQNVKDIIKKQQEDNVRINNEFQISYVMENTKDFYAKRLVLVKDFGTLEEYLDNKNSPIVRFFNSVEYDGDIVIKSSAQRHKMISEYMWFNNIPDNLKIYTPHTFSCDPYSGDVGYYTLEKVNSPTLRDVFLFLDYSVESWSIIIDNLFEYIDKEASYTTDAKDFFVSDYQKVKRRLSFTNNQVEDFMEAYKSFSEFNTENTVMHGDLCFSNILYDMSSNKFKLIDPKGPIYGSYIYDLAKIFHSIMYPYDFIDTDLYSKKPDDSVIFYDSNREPIRKMFIEKFLENFDEDLLYKVKLVTAALYLSMLPIHAHSPDHQAMFYAVFSQIVEELKIG